MTKIVLPKGKTEAKRKNPKNLIVFSLPKVGKTELFAALKDSLIIDLEEGSDFIDVCAIKATTVEEIIAIGKQIDADGNPYKYLIVDTATSLEELCWPYAEQIYSGTPQGANWFVKDTGGKAKYGKLIHLPKGNGYNFLREAMVKVLEFLKKKAPNFILSVHVKSVSLEKNGAEITINDLDVTGKLKRILAAQADGVGYLYRKKPNQNHLSFITTEDFVVRGARPTHLSNVDMLISEKTEDGELITHWDKVYLD